MRRIIRKCAYTVKKTANVERYHLFDSAGKPASFWHDIPYRLPDYLPNEFNFVCEIPLNRLAKLEVDKKARYNPIVQDTKKHPITNKWSTDTTIGSPSGTTGTSPRPGKKTSLCRSTAGWW